MLALNRGVMAHHHVAAMQTIGAVSGEPPVPAPKRATRGGRPYLRRQ